MPFMRKTARSSTLFGVRIAAGGARALAAIALTGAALAGCAQPHACRQVLLTSATSQASARVVIKGNVAWLIPSRLPADNSTEQVYVLWQITGAHVPLAVGSFDVSGRGGMTIRIGRLAVPYRGTLAFAVSLENGRTIPAAPSHLVALGQVSA